MYDITFGQYSPNWIGIIDVGTVGSTLEMMEYEASLHALSSFPPSHLSAPFPGISNYDSSITNLIDDIIAKAMETIPQQYHKSGVLCIYSTSSVSESAIDTICAHVQKTSKLRILECQQMNGIQRAALAWAANFVTQKRQHGIGGGRTIVELEGTNLVIANDIYQNCDFNSTDKLELGFATGSAINFGPGITDLYLKKLSFLSELEPEELNSCILARGGSYAQCQVALNHPIQRIIDPLLVSVNNIKYDSMLQRVVANTHVEERVHALCSGDSQNDSLDCLEAMFQYKVSKHMKEGIERHNKSTAWTHSWSVGRGLLYAAAQLAPETDTEMIGIRKPGTARMELGSGPLPMQPAIKRNSNPLHHLLGSIILLSALVSVLYLLLGAVRRRKLWAALTGRRQWTLLSGEEADDAGQIELDEYTHSHEL